jgi:hypothetical protein
MKITESDLTLFNSLAQTESGKQLLDYLKRVEDYAHDSRSWKEGDTKESAAHAARLIKDELIERIKPSSDDPKVVNEYE